jgi:hypothetical protein
MEKIIESDPILISTRARFCQSQKAIMGSSIFQTLSLSISLINLLKSCKWSFAISYVISRLISS